jgi:hypothetical protein
MQLATYPGFGNIRLQENPLTGTYNSFQVGLRQQNKHGLSFELDYTYSHQIDDSQSSVDVDNNNPSFNPWNLKYDKGSGAWIAAISSTATTSTRFLCFNHASGLEHTVLGGWEVSGTFISEAGMPWLGNTAPGDGGADTVGLGGDYRIRPNLAGKPVYTKGKTTVGNVTGYQWVSSANFSQPVAAWNGARTWASAMPVRMLLSARPHQLHHCSLQVLCVHREGSFRAPAESFNTFNHTQFNAINNGLNFSATGVPAANFGFVTGAQDPREFEIGGKFQFLTQHSTGARQAIPAAPLFIARTNARTQIELTKCVGETRDANTNPTDVDDAVFPVRHALRRTVDRYTREPEAISDCAGATGPER